MKVIVVELKSQRQLRRCSTGLPFSRSRGDRDGGHAVGSTPRRSLRFKLYWCRPPVWTRAFSVAVLDGFVAAHSKTGMSTSIAPRRPLQFRGRLSLRLFAVPEGSPTYVNVYGPSGFEGRSCGCATVNQQSITIELTPGIAMERLRQQLRLREPRRVL